MTTAMALTHLMLTTCRCSTHALCKKLDHQHVQSSLAPCYFVLHPHVKAACHGVVLHLLVVMLGLPDCHDRTLHKTPDPSCIQPHAHILAHASALRCRSANQVHHSAAPRLQRPATARVRRRLHCSPPGHAGSTKGQLSWLLKLYRQARSPRNPSGYDHKHCCSTLLHRASDTTDLATNAGAYMWICPCCYMCCTASTVALLPAGRVQHVKAPVHWDSMQEHFIVYFPHLSARHKEHIHMYTQGSRSIWMQLRLQLMFSSNCNPYAAHTPKWQPARSGPGIQT